MSQLQPTRTMHADSRQALGVYNDAGEWQENYTDHNHTYTSNPTGKNFFYVPKWRAGVKDKNGVEVPDFGALPLVSFQPINHKTNALMVDAKGAPVIRTLVNWDKVPKETLLKVYFWECFSEHEKLQKVYADLKEARKQTHHGGDGHGHGEGGSDATTSVTVHVHRGGDGGKKHKGGHTGGGHTGGGRGRSQSRPRGEPHTHAPGSRDASHSAPQTHAAGRRPGQYDGQYAEPGP